MTSFIDEAGAREYWWNKANELRKAAGTIWLATNDKLTVERHMRNTEFPNIGRSYAVCWMLYGLSLEVLLKCIIVANNKTPDPIHDLVKLSQQAGVVYGDKELQLLDILRESIEWDGKYSVPKKEEIWNKMCEVEEKVRFNSEPMGSGWVSAPNENWGWKPYDELFEKTAEYLVL